MRILLALEGSSDRRRIGVLIDRWLADNVTWLDPDNLDMYRHFAGTGLDADKDYLPIKQLPLLRRAFGGGGFGRAHPSGDAGLIHDLRIVLAGHGLEPDVIVWVRDVDTADGREAEAINEVERASEGDRFVIGYPRQTSEAWVLVGWQALSPSEAQAERAVQDATKRRIVRDAHLFSHQRTAAGNAKWAVEQLMPDFGRQDESLIHAWALADRDIEACGLAGFRRAMSRGLGRLCGVAHDVRSDDG